MTVNIPIHVDDDLMNKFFEEDFGSKVEDILSEKINDALKDYDPSFYSKSAKRGVQELASDEIKRLITNDWKDSIIKEAGKILADRVGRTKAAKEIVK